MKRIFYFSNFQLTIFHWQRKKCIARYTFNSSQQGLEKFKTYLLETNNAPVRILLDLIEEDFKQKSIPHVNAIDRKSIISRLLKRQHEPQHDRQHNSNKSYIHYKVIGREKTKRKYDILRYSILNNSQTLEPWGSIMANSNTSICGIWSLPLLSESLFNKLKPNVDNILLVSQQNPNSLRQSFIIKAKLQSSRTSILNLTDTSIEKCISTEINQTLKFLSNQKKINIDNKIEIHILCREKDIVRLQSCLKNSALCRFHYHTANNILRFNNFSSDYNDGIFSYICSEKLTPIGHYKQYNLFTHFYQQTLSKAFNTASIILILISIALTFHFISESLIFENESRLITSQEKTILRKNKKDFFDIQEKLSKTQFIQSSVLLAKKIQKYKHVSPQNFMIDISHILSTIDMHDTKITHIIWRQQQNNMPPSSMNSDSINYVNSTIINQHVTIGGLIPISDGNLKASVVRFNAIVDTFKNYPFIEHVKINRAPINIQSNTNIIGNNKKGEFEIEFILKSYDI